jgi:hypothetical protein
VQASLKDSLVVSHTEEQAMQGIHVHKSWQPSGIAGQQGGDDSILQVTLRDEPQILPCVVDMMELEYVGSHTVAIGDTNSAMDT